jgi:mannose/cellobiose epimerase-like protein (N-acyl-D-glucosamine 2-epimerase family)
MTANAIRIRAWLQHAALPLWSDAGVDREAGGFVERLYLDGRPDLAAAKRVRVQARQIYVYSHAKLLGFAPDGDAVATQGYDFLMRYACPDGLELGFVHALAREGAVASGKRDTYDHAFVLFALSWFHQATGRDDVRRAIGVLSDAIWTLLRRDDGLGFHLDDGRGAEMHQNPHMHLLEALLAAYDATQDARQLERATELFDLFRERMFDPGPGVLREYFGVDWRPAAGEQGRIVEPGHHCEWVWLLKRYADRIGAPLCEEAWRLADFVERHGRSESGLLVDELWADGRVKKASTRSWPQTEAIKAEVALAEAGGRPVRDRADVGVDALFDRYLDRPVRGAWIDWIDADGAPLAQAIPASTFYHLFLGFAEYLKANES